MVSTIWRFFLLRYAILFMCIWESGLAYNFMMGAIRLKMSVQILSTIINSQHLKLIRILSFNKLMKINKACENIILILQ